jgi:hypothetical protein
MKAESKTNARLKVLAAALAVLEKIDRGEAGFLFFAGVTPARRAMAEVIERMDTYTRRGQGGGQVSPPFPIIPQSSA